jgi:hypothetical protein
MKNLTFLGAAALVFCAAASLPAAVVTVTDGASAGIANGNATTGVGTWNTDTAGNAAPFNGFIGSDTTGPNFSANWTFGYSPISDTILSATLLVGIYDLDSAAALNEVASYTEGAIDLTSLLNAVSNALNGGTGAVNKEYDLLTITLPSTTFADLATGTANISLTLQGPGLGIPTLGNTTFNGAGIDISTLTITTQAATAPTPEPGTLTLLLASGCLVGLIAGRRRRQRA